MTKKPNILIIISDQLRRDALGIYGDPNISTPNIDHLASEGVRFQNACSTYPVCVPFRFTLMTGEHAHSRLVPAIEWRMSPAERTLADEFNGADYHTIYIGKWHLYGGSGLLPKHYPKKANKTPVPRLHQGRWQKWLGFEIANNPFDTYYFEDDDPIPRPLGKYQTDGLFDLAMEYIEKDFNSDKPYCCILSVEPPHYPLIAPKELAKKWRDKSIKLPPNFLFRDKFPAPGPIINDNARERRASIKNRKTYYAMVENLDDNVGRLLDFIEKSGQKEKTIIIFMSDHGEMGGAHCIRNIIKDHPYEESIGIALIVYDPRNSKRSGQVINEPVCTEDYFPTLLGLAGLKPKEKKPGIDLTPLIHGKQEKLPREGIYLEFLHELRQGEFFTYYEKFWRGFRSQQYKYTVLGDAEEKDEIIRYHKLLRESLIRTCDHYVLADAYGIKGVNLWK